MRDRKKLVENIFSHLWAFPNTRSRTWTQTQVNHEIMSKGAFFSHQWTGGWISRGGIEDTSFFIFHCGWEVKEKYMHVNNTWNLLLILRWVQFFGKPYIKLLLSPSIRTIWMVRTVNVYRAVRFHQCWCYLNKNCLFIDLPFLLELIHFLNFDFLVYLSSDDEMMEPQSSSTPWNAISTGMNCNECNWLSESLHLKWLHNIFSLPL